MVQLKHVLLVIIKLKQPIHFVQYVLMQMLYVILQEKLLNAKMVFMQLLVQVLVLHVELKLQHVQQELKQLLVIQDMEVLQIVQSHV